MTASPKISIVVPLFNKAAFVSEALESVRAQTLAAYEIIVVDDGSTDEGAEIVRKLDCANLHLITQTNAGVSVARNRGIEAARGDFVAFLDADDRYAPGFLEGIACLVARYPAAAMYCTAYKRFWDDGRREFCRLQHVALNTGVILNDFYGAWCSGAFTFTSAIAIRRNVFDDLTLRFPEGERLGEDQDLWFRIAERHQVAYLNTASVDYRMGVAGSATQATPVTELLPCYRRLGERLAGGGVPARMRRGARRLFASHLLNVARARVVQGDRVGAVRMLADSRVLSNPFYFLRTACVLVLDLLGFHRNRVT